ncbi:Kinase [Hexamita inflata]|uniref:Kinase n=1 Tax=Hexamita inflata TaxID=28002 RepID=A0AA86R6R8_9EUKA|nr:Kinase [Hexamita inflata]
MNLLELKNALAVPFTSFQTALTINKSALFLHQRVHSDETRNIFRLSFKQLIKQFMRGFKHDSRFIRLCFKYARMFKDSQQLIQYFSRQGMNNIEFTLQLAQHYVYSEHNREKAIILLDQYSDQNNIKIQRLRFKLANMNSLWVDEQSEDDNNIPMQSALTYVQYEEQRLVDNFDKEFNEYKLSFNDQIIKPYNYIALDKMVISKMLQFLQPKNRLEVYYSYKDVTSVTEPIFIPITDKVSISYIEMVNVIPSELYIDQKIEFKTEYSSNLLILKRELGEGGFGKVYKTELYQNNQVYNLAVKFFIREKDQLQVHQAISGSYLRELYAMATILQRATLLTGDLLQQVDLPFTKLYCGLVGEKGNGAILMQYISGQNLYEIVKTSDDSLSDYQIRKYFKQMVEITSLVHKCDVLHCDIKIDNWILSQDKLYLCDFGKAIDLKLFILNQESNLQFDYKYLNSVSPSLSCQNSYLFQADFCGLAGCLYTLLKQKILGTSDVQIINNIITIDKLKISKNVDLYNQIFNILLNYKSPMQYISAKEDSINQLQQISQLLD